MFGAMLIFRKETCITVLCFLLCDVLPFVVLADGSFEYTDSTGTDLHDFIIKTLRNPR